MKKYKPILFSSLLFVFGYILIFISNATFAFESAIKSVFVISILYALIGFFWTQKNKFILLPIGLHFLIIQIATWKTERGILDTRIFILFFTPILCFTIAQFLKKQKYSKAFLVVSLVTINALSVLIFSNRTFESHKSSTFNQNIDSFDIKKNLNLLSLKDSSVYNIDIKNKILVLDFWYVNCRPCREFAPHYKSLNDDYCKDSSIIFLSINDGRIDTYLKANELLTNLDADKHLFYYDKDGVLAKSIDVQGYPDLIIINKQGKIAYRQSGFSYDETFVFSNKMHEIIDKIKAE